MTASVRIQGLEALLRQLAATPRQIQRSARNAIDGVAGARQRFIRKEVNASTGIKQKDINQKLTRRRTRQNTLESMLTASNEPFLLRQYRLRKTRTRYPTRRGVIASIFLRRGPQPIDRVFINPKGSGQRLLRRPAFSGRYPVRTPKGLSMAQYMAHLMDQGFLQETETDLTSEFFKKLDAQLSRANRR